jgi:hypothetical protein
VLLPVQEITLTEALTTVLFSTVPLQTLTGQKAAGMLILVTGLYLIIAFLEIILDLGWLLINTLLLALAVFFTTTWNTGGLGVLEHKETEWF